ncbi:hypothetical protein [Cryptosporangium minutisporangium]|uniref:Calcineurin-like phosphoesterase domain-containing protein n=1 Tax=Cryptosporangium minutisporangium TaxID=113569 RepID=A0ABP6SZH1_9ACTN
MPDRRGADGPPILVAHVAGPHVARPRRAGSRAGSHLSAAIETLAADVVAAKPTLTVVTGECTTPFGDDELGAVHALLNRLPLPRLTLFGAHVPPRLRDRLSGPITRPNGPEQETPDPLADVPGVRGVGLQSMSAWQCATGQIPARHAAAVRRALVDTPPSTARLVALHHRPALSSPGGPRSLTGALVDARVDVVLAGSSRVPSVRRSQLWSGGLRYPVVEVVSECPGASATRSGSLSWSLLRVDAHSITVEQRHLLDGGWRTGRSVQYLRGQ